MDRISLCAHLSKLAYGDVETICNGLDDLGLFYFGWLENRFTDTQGFACADNNHIYIAIRGTEGGKLEDWKTNLDCTFKSHLYGSVHRGFFEAAQSIYAQVRGTLDFHMARGRTLITTGHSLGAAVAKQIGIETMIRGIGLYQHWGFGEPRSVSKISAAYLDAHFPGLFNRVVNNNDVVTRIPTRSMGFKHHGSLHYFKEHSEYTTDPSAWIQFLDRIHGRFDDIGKPGTDGLKDHPIDEYVRIVDAAFS